MGFIAVCTALYDYQPQSEEELEIKEGELLYILEKDNDDDWWKAKKKAEGDDDEEPEGLIPFNYIQEARPSQYAKALYDYSRQTDEEVSFTEDASLDVYDTSDPDWTLVGYNGEFGFAPANYIEIIAAAKASTATPSLPTRTPIPAAPETTARSPTPTSPVRDHQSAAATLARVIGGGAQQSPIAPRAPATPPTPQDQAQFTPEASDEEEQGPALPQRPQSQTITSPIIPQQATYSSPEPAGVLPSPPYNRASLQPDRDDAPTRSPGGYHLYNISEMVSVMGRRKKMPTTLGLNLATGTIMLSPEKTRDGPTQEWTADKLSHYSIEGKHVFMELIRPSKSLDLHAGAKDTAQEIVRTLGEIAGAQRAEGFKEVIAAASGSSGGGQRKGVVLYDFMAQGDDEVTVAIGDEVIVLDDEKSEEWWNIRRVKNGKEGVMPSSYIEVTGVVAPQSSSRTGAKSAKSTVEQNRIEEERLAREAARANRIKQEAEEARARDIQLPQRGSSLAEEESHRPGRKDKKASRSDGKARSKPDPNQTRTWTDHSGSFKVEAQFIGIADGKIHLHKVNGVKIAVPVTKMSPTDLEYVEKVTHESIEEHIPVADLIKLKRKNQAPDSSAGRAGASIEPSKPQAAEYDWFDFFLVAGVGPHQCERYAQAMVKDSMDETVLPEITTDTLRTLGLKEGDALKVMKYLDQRFNRSKTNGATDAVQGGIFSGPGGVLHNNTRRGRPDTNRQTNDVVDPEAFGQGDTKTTPSEAKAISAAQAPTREPQNGFDDDAWEVKPSSQPPTAIQAPAATPMPKSLSDNAQALSLLDRPLEPTPAAPARPASQPQLSQQPTASMVSPAPQQSQAGANPAFFSQLNQQPQATGQPNTTRQRPQAPQQNFPGLALLPPPPRPTSAPHNAQQSQFAQQPLQAQLTGIPRTAAAQTAPGQSLDEMTAQRMQQQFQMQPQPTGYGQMYGSFPNGMQPQPTGFQLQQFSQPQHSFVNGNASGSPFADPRPSFQPQPTGFNLQPGPAPGSLNSVLPPALIPQKTGYQPPPQQMSMNGYNSAIQPQATGFLPLQPHMTGYQQQMQPQSTGWAQSPQSNGFGSIQLPPVPPLPQQSTPAPLIPQKTGPAPDVRFGVTEARKLAPQPTGRRANLAAATPQNPFGF